MEKKKKTGQLKLTVFSVSTLASSQESGGGECNGTVEVICLRKVQSKLVKMAQPGSAS